jgi:hypothetical protein
MDRIGFSVVASSPEEFQEFQRREIARWTEVVQRGNIFSHGDTAEKAIQDLRYKLADRDTTKYKKWKLDSVHPLADMIQAYRAITGACEAGTKQWCEGKKFPAKLSVNVAIRATKGAYRAEQFAAFFKKSQEAMK